MLVHANSHGEENDANCVSLYYVILLTARSLFVFHHHFEIYTGLAIFLYSLSGYMSVLQSTVVIVGVLVTVVVVVLIVVVVFVQ